MCSVCESLRFSNSSRNTEPSEPMGTGFLNTKTIEGLLYGTIQLPLRKERTRETLFFQCEVMFGSPSSNCSGNGICKIVAQNNRPAATFMRSSCSHAKALFCSSDDGNEAYMVFQRGWLCSNLMRRHFRHGVLEMREPCPIPPTMASALGLRIRELPAGLHLIEDHGTHFHIHFRHNDLI